MAEPEPESLIELSANFLSHRDFSNCRNYALLAQKSEHNLSSADQIIAIADVLVAGDRRIGEHHPDWYSVLQLRRRDDAVHPTLREHFKRLILLLAPSRNQFAFSREAYRLVCDAWSILSNSERKARYDGEIGPEEADQPEGTFWTACPYCFYVYEYDKVYEECCLSCQICRRGFHGAAMAAPPPSTVLDGKEVYFSSPAFFPVGYSKSETSGGPTDPPCSEAADERSNAFVEISDDSPEECEIVGNHEKNGGVGRNGVKTVARKTRKLMGKGRKGVAGAEEEGRW